MAPISSRPQCVKGHQCYIWYNATWPRRHCITARLSITGEALHIRESLTRKNMGVQTGCIALYIYAILHSTILSAQKYLPRLFSVQYIPELCTLFSIWWFLWVVIVLSCVVKYIADTIKLNRQQIAADDLKWIREITLCEFMGSRARHAKQTHRGIPRSAVIHLTQVT